MNSENIISFNFANWVTVVLIAGTGFAGLGFLQKMYAKKTGTA